MKNILVALLFLITQKNFCQNPLPTGCIPSSVTVSNINEHHYFKFGNSSNSIVQINWDIAITNEIHEIGIKINELNGVKLWKIFKDTSAISSITLNDTSYQVFNSSEFMYQGAFDTIYKGSLALYFNVGYGNFEQTSTGFIAYGTCCFIIKLDDGSFRKLYVSRYIDREYQLYVSNIDNTNGKYISIKKSTYGQTGNSFNSHYTYYDFNTEASSTVYEPSGIKTWDIIFKPYQIIQGNTIETYPIGALLNNANSLLSYSKLPGVPANYLAPVTNTQAYQASGDVLSIQYNESLNTTLQTNNFFNQIGASWYSKTTQQVIPNNSYFVRDGDGKIWHLIFNNYNATSKQLSFCYKQVAQTTIGISPLDIDKEVTLDINSKDLNIHSNTLGINEVTIYDMMGRSLFNESFKENITIDFNDYKNKLVLINIKTKNSSFTHKYVFK